MALLAAAGITPDAVAGHSVGEVAAAYAAGVLSLEDACALVAARARLMQALPGWRGDGAVAATEAEVTPGAGGRGRGGGGGGERPVGGGDLRRRGRAVDGVAGRFRGRGPPGAAAARSHAFHSHRMDPVLAELGEIAAGLEHAAPRVPWAGALAGELVGRA